LAFCRGLQRWSPLCKEKVARLHSCNLYLDITLLYIICVSWRSECRWFNLTPSRTCSCTMLLCKGNPNGSATSARTCHIICHHIRSSVPEVEHASRWYLISVTKKYVTGRVSGRIRKTINGLDLAKTYLVTGWFVEQINYQIIRLFVLCYSVICLEQAHNQIICN
jgi:hypothetical protein